MLYTTYLEHHDLTTQSINETPRFIFSYGNKKSLRLSLNMHKSYLEHYAHDHVHTFNKVT